MEAGDESSGRVARWIKSAYLDQRKMGKANGKGVYTYRNPEYEDPNFLKGETEKEHDYSDAVYTTRRNYYAAYVMFKDCRSRDPLAERLLSYYIYQR